MKYIIITSFIILFFGSCHRTTQNYYRSGELKEEFYKDGRGLKQGEAIRYYISGGIEIKSNYVNDTLDGAFEEYYPNGQLKIRTTFIRGVQNGELVEYFEDGKIKQEANYVNGKSDGINTFYYHNGKISTRAIVKESVTQYYTSYDSLGEINDVRHSMYLEILSTLRKGDSIRIRERVPGFVSDKMNPMYALIEKYGTIKTGDVPKMKLNPIDSMYYITFPPQIDTGRYIISTFFHAVYKLKYSHKNDTIVIIK